MLLLLALLVIGILVWISGRREAEQQRQRTLVQQLQQSNQGWIDFIAGYAAVATTKSEKAIVARMLADIKAQQGGVPSNDSAIIGGTVSLQSLANKEAAVGRVDFGTPSESWQTVSQAQALAHSRTQTASQTKASVQLDNASLLLYFGAFLFVASAGLFVAFGNASSGLKVFTVLLVTAVMYASGVWLNRNRPKLRQAGQAFAGIGIVLAPLVGVALYSYLFDHRYGAVVWMLTSLFCLGLYAHALKTFRTPLMGYVMVFTFLSLFESGVGVASVPVYYYGWGLALVGIGLQLLNRWGNWWPELRQPSRQSSQLFLPLALLVSLATIDTLGAAQLGVSLLLAAAFYGLEIFKSTGSEQEGNAVASQLAFTAGCASLGYGLHANSQHWLNVVWILLAVQALQLTALLLYDVRRPGAHQKLWQNFGSVLMATSIASIGIAILFPAGPKLFIATIVGTVIVSVGVWVRQRRADAYALASLAWMGLPYVIINTSPSLDASVTAFGQALAGLGALAVLLAVYLMYVKRAASHKTLVATDWTEWAGAAYGIGAASVLLAGAFAGPLACLVITLAVAATFIVLAEQTAIHAAIKGKQAGWTELAAITLLIPVLRSWDDPKAFLLTVIISLAVLIILSLRYRRELLRWSSTVAWLLLPYALGHGGLGAYWPSEAYAWAYIVAMAGLIFSRAIARGTLFLSGNVPVSSMMRSASQSYASGYIFAALVAVCVSLSSSHSQVHTSLILGLLTVTIVLVARHVEKRADILAILPLMLQALLLSGIRPEHSGPLLQAYLLTSSVLAVISYTVAYDAAKRRPELLYAAQTAIVAAFVAPATVLFADNSWAMSVGLLAAGVILSHYIRNQSQAAREWSGAVIVLAVMWFMGWAGVHQFLAYTYVVVATLGFYAYWRTIRGETQKADEYLWAMLAVATVPLALRAIDGTSGDLYGWWFLLEQVAIMLLGMSIKRRFVTLWGLYAAVAAVLYQLRGLGYAALAVLALFLIGLAIYRIQKNDSDRQ